MRRLFLMAAALVLWAAAARPAQAQVTLTTSTIPRYANGKVICSAVNVGADGALDVTIELIDVNTGQVVATEPCIEGSTNGSVPRGERCKAEKQPTNDQILWCKIEVDLPANDSGTQNPSLAALAQRVRGSIVAQSSDASAFVALPAL